MTLRGSAALARAALLGLLFAVWAAGVGTSSSHAAGVQCTMVPKQCRSGPTAMTGPALGITTDAATLVGVLSPRGASISYYFEYGADGRYTSRTRSGRSSGHGSRLVVRMRLRRLSAGTMYRYRIVANSRYGLSRGVGRALRTANIAPTVYWGAQIGPQFTGTTAPWDVRAIKAFAKLAGKRPSLVAFNIPFVGCGTPTTCNPWVFPAVPMINARKYGAIPLLNWASMSDPLSVNEPGFSLAAVTGGTYDRVIRHFATQAKAWGHPFLLRFDWEMNGNWFPWAEAANGNGPGQFVAAWRHVHDIFRAVGASNATWVWCPTADYTNDMTNLGELYPGNRYTDWTCIDGYNLGTLTDPNGWLTFDQIFSSTYNQITTTIAPSKPMLIGEFASSEHGGSKAAWIRSALTDIPAHYPRIRGIVWFDMSEGADDWPIETSPTATDAFKQAIANPVYATSAYGRLATSPIPAPLP